MNTKTNKSIIFAHQILAHGVEHEQYFQGCGVSHTEFDEVFTGIGSSPREAYDDAEEQLHCSLSPLVGDDAMVDEARDLSSLGATLGDGQYYYVSIRVRTTPNEHSPIENLAVYLECHPDDIREEDYTILTDDEATAAAKEYILDSLWAFRPEFLQAHLKDGIDASSLVPMQEKLCESATPIIRALIEDIDHFVDDAIRADGRGHFLSPYDGEEIELQNGFFAYRQN